ncbi:hypothetical protein D3C76_976660 [compost metagenome]
MAEQQRQGDAAGDPGHLAEMVEIGQADDHRPVPQVDGIGAVAEPLREPAGSPARIAAMRQQHQRRPRDREQRPPARPGHLRGEAQDRRQDHRQPQPGQPLRQQPGQPHDTGQKEHQRPGEQFPRARLPGEEGPRRLPVGQIGEMDAPAQRGGEHQAQPDDYRAVVRRHLPERPQHHRQEQVELPFDRQRPGVQQPLLMGTGVEVARFVQIAQVRGERQTVADVAGEVPIFLRQQGEPADRQQRRADHQQRRHDAPHPRPVELPEREVPRLQGAQNDSGHQEAGNHEEHVDADEAALQPRHFEVIQHYRDDCPGAQTVDVGAKPPGCSLPHAQSLPRGTTRHDPTARPPGNGPKWSTGILGYRWRIFSTIMVVELLATRSSTRTSPP